MLSANWYGASVFVRFPQCGVQSALFTFLVPAWMSPPTVLVNETVLVRGGNTSMVSLYNTCSLNAVSWVNCSQRLAYETEQDASMIVTWQYGSFESVSATLPALFLCSCNGRWSNEDNRYGNECDGGINCPMNCKCVGPNFGPLSPPGASCACLYNCQSESDQQDWYDTAVCGWDRCLGLAHRVWATLVWEDATTRVMLRIGASFLLSSLLVFFFFFFLVVLCQT
jgi:hypothetical protein